MRVESECGWWYDEGKTETPREIHPIGTYSLVILVAPLYKNGSIIPYLFIQYI